MKRISLFSALLILLMFLASCNAVSRTDPEKGNTDNAVSLEEGGFDIGEKDVSTTMNKRIIDFTIDDIKFFDGLEVNSINIPADFVRVEKEHTEVPETRVLTIDSTDIRLEYRRCSQWGFAADEFFVDEDLDPNTKKSYFFSNETGELTGYDFAFVEGFSDVVKYRTYDEFLGAALTVASKFADLSKWDYDIDLHNMSPTTIEQELLEVSKYYCFNFVRKFSGLNTVEYLSCFIRGDGQVGCYFGNIGMFDDVQPIDLDLYKLQSLSEEKLSAVFDSINSQPGYTVKDIRLNLDWSRYFVNKQGDLEFHYTLEFDIEYFPEDAPEALSFYQQVNMYIVLD